MDAHVEVDRRNRITKYRANDGSVNFEGEYPPSKKQTNGTQENPPESTKRAAEEVPNCSSKRSRIDFWGPGADHLSSGFFEHFNQIRAPFESYPLSGSMDILSHPGVEEPPNQRIQEFREPKREMESPGAPEAPETTVVLTEAVERAPEALGASVPAPEASRPHTSQIKFLEAIKSLVISLDTPTLSGIQSKIEQKIWETGQSNNGIPNDELVLVMDLLVARISNNSVFDLPEYVESVSFKEFLCYLKCVILSLKLEGLEGLLEKIKEKNKEVAMKDKKIPVEKVAVILQYALDFI
ncbi:hypothetical protein CAEBREN_01222 [Caenorhabditis brenneri]|uniref:SPK domain-containing protein n=1 Tax=Caenorhabditis brenneri TaxID=135651 RepID=G0NGH2_CAEBE|nr:hypothetical protein CAEBREN_01222 [Caenorhabditis brenneri]